MAGMKVIAAAYYCIAVAEQWTTPRIEIVLTAPS
jgi:hypothetical protein